MAKPLRDGQPISRKIKTVYKSGDGEGSAVFACSQQSLHFIVIAKE
jgi:hypothetical protein